MLSCKDTSSQVNQDALGCDPLAGLRNICVLCHLYCPGLLRWMADKYGQPLLMPLPQNRAVELLPIGSDREATRQPDPGDHGGERYNFR
jgi:hypothetical protein